MAAQQVVVADVEALPGETLSFTIQLDTESDGRHEQVDFKILLRIARRNDAAVIAAYDQAWIFSAYVRFYFSFPRASNRRIIHSVYLSTYYTLG